jgi:diacylglycerol kinase
MASAAVFLSYINCIVVWVIMLWPDNTVWHRIGAMLSGH